uniref:E3 ubiquitin-protein ligase MARCHF5 n=1 Tax=Ditylenchus dipsaci TaxID=166011 RepID=A0A915ELL8_9BILA
MAELDKSLVETEINRGKRMCKICYDEVNEEDVDESEWISPCNCGGSIKWVHKSCMLLWMHNGTSDNRSRCGLCRYDYRWHWRVKSVSEWSIPAFDLTLWQITGIFFDAVFTVHFFWQLLDILKRPTQLLNQVFDLCGGSTLFTTGRRISTVRWQLLYRNAWSRRLFWVLLESFLDFVFVFRCIVSSKIKN